RPCGACVDQSVLGAGAPRVPGPFSSRAYQCLDSPSAYTSAPRETSRGDLHIILGFTPSNIKKRPDCAKGYLTGGAVRPVLGHGLEIPRYRTALRSAESPTHHPVLLELPGRL